MELNEKHIENTKLIANRARLLEHFPKNAVVAEIGVAEGKYSEKILSTTKPKELHLIDIWDSERFGETAMLAVRDKFKEPIDAGRIAALLDKAAAPDAQAEAPPLAAATGRWSGVGPT